MIVYHGSNMEVIRPDILHSRDNLDFGKGFYITPLYEQAKKWAKRFKVRKGSSIVSKYELDEEHLYKNFTVKKFDSYSDEWLDYIIACRSGEHVIHYDAIIGGVANDKVFDTIELFFDGLIEKSVAIEKLRYEKPNLQICFCTQEAIDRCILFLESEAVG